MTDNDIGLRAAPFSFDDFDNPRDTFYQVMTARKTVIRKAVKKDKIEVACTIVLVESLVHPDLGPQITVTNNRPRKSQAKGSSD